MKVIIQVFQVGQSVIPFIIHTALQKLGKLESYYKMFMSISG